ncbi:ABC transporter permease [Frankia nepalensis]|uniref:ABC transporter permease n=1 Tax=Frankia nepalensis TaxID=1836974 RepID=UPI0027DCDCDE|nr:FtsX-like permease family protein [Frankia nepalensis]
MARVWRPVWAWLRLDLRRRWLSLLMLALLVALATGTVMTAAAGARRGASALDRILAVTSPATVAAVPNEPGFDWEAVRRLPGVEAVGTILLTGSYAIEGHPEIEVLSPAMDDETMRTVERPAVLAGRLPDPARADEAVVSPRFVETTGLSVGDTVTALLPTPAATDAAALNEEPISYTGPRQPLTIVGVVRSGWWTREPQDSPGGLGTTFAFTETYRENLVGATGDAAIVNAMVRLSAGAAGIPAFQEALDRLATHPVETLNVVEDQRKFRETTTFEAAGLAAFALAAYLAAVVLLGQAVVRLVIGATADLGVLRTLGLTTRQATVAAAAGPVLATAAGLLAGAGAAVAVSPLFPLGSAALVEPEPGVDLDVSVILAVSGVTLLLVAVAATTTAFATSVGGVRPARPRGSAAARLAYRLGLPVPVLTGVRFALEPGRAGAAVRPALVGAVVGVLGVVGSLTFQAGVADAAANPARFGQTFAVVSIVGFNDRDFGPADDVVRAAAADPDVVAVNDTRVGVATVERRPVTVFSLDEVAGRPSSVQVLAGRLPATPGEIVLAPGVARRTGARVGDVLTVAGRDPADGTPMRLTGLAFVPQDPHTTYDEGGWVSASGYHALFDGGFKYHEVRVELRPGASTLAVRDRLNEAVGADDAFFVVGDELPLEAQDRFRGVAVLPRFLGAFLGVLAVGAVGHALFVGVRRRRHEVAVLRALGTTRWQARAIVLTQAAVIGAIGLAVGVPVGVLLGRALWRAVATSTPLIYVPPVAALALALAVPTAVLAVGLLASVPARRAARLHVPDVLRAE